MVACGTVMLAVILLAAFVGSFLGVPDDIEAWSRYQEQFEQDVANGNVYTDEELKKRVGEPPTEEPPPVEMRQFLMNSLLFRPWVVLPFVLVSLLILRPRTRECVLAACGVALLLLSVGQMHTALFFGLSVILYLAGCILIPAKR